MFQVVLFYLLHVSKNKHITFNGILLFTLFFRSLEKKNWTEIEYSETDISNQTHSEDSLSGQEEWR